MKALICEMCNSNDLVKQDGLFVCQSCGTKYSVEEAKKMMFEGTVKVDNTEELTNLYQLARRAKKAENNVNAAKYYEMILIKDPTSWEANFYTVYFKSMSCKIAEIAMAATDVNNCIESTFVLIKENIADAEERKSAITEVKNSAYSISDMLFNAATSHMNDIDPMIKDRYQMEYLSNVIAAGGIKKTVCDKLCEVFANDREVFSKLGVKILKDRIDEGIAVDASDNYVKLIQKYDPSYEAPKGQTTEEIMNRIQNNNSGCYVATAVYGSYDCAQVWTLRRFRDDTLASTWYGRAFIHIYYAISPTLVQWFGETLWFKNIFKPTLDKMVRNLNDKGVENTPYNDKQW